MNMHCYFLVALSTGLIWAGITLIATRSPAWALVTFSLAFPVSFFMLLLVAGGSCIEEPEKPDYYVCQELE